MATATATRKRPPKTATGKVEYVNTTQGWLGAIRINRRGEEQSLAIEPNGRVFLSDEEKDLTEQSHAKREDSPFTPREIIYRDPNTFEEIGRATLCPLEPAANFARSGGKVQVP